jgi:hypothetical protein
MTRMSAIDAFMPTWEVAARHDHWVDAAPAQVADALRTADLGRPWVVRLLMSLRSLPAALGRPRSGRALASSFVVLADEPDEYLLGLQGRFWTPTGGLVPVEPHAFAEGPLPGLAQAVWNFRVEPERGGTRLSTETRVRTGDAGSARSFRRYWRVVGPFSGLMRRHMLALVARRAEAASRTL